MRRSTGSPKYTEESYLYLNIMKSESVEKAMGPIGNVRVSGNAKKMKTLKVRYART
jgi:hypothetical protein